MTPLTQMLLLPLFFVVVNCWPRLWLHNSINRHEVQRLNLVNPSLSIQLQNIPNKQIFQTQELPKFNFIIKHMAMQYPDLFSGFGSGKVIWWNAITGKPTNQNIYIYVDDDDQQTDPNKHNNEDDKQDNAVTEQNKKGDGDKNTRVKPVSDDFNNADEVLPIDPRKDEAKFTKPH